ncbi:unnamed protein product [Urochloa decumbens]|uniref:BTB domain-containing protein n=1 Tax=Urochloa decumbens TaxID=240449 RepID=A0ABC8W0Z7_9POAL
MNHTFTQVREVVSSVLQIKIDGFPMAMAKMKDGTDSFKSTCNVDGYDWEIRFLGDRDDYPGLELVFLGESRTSLMAVLSVKVVVTDKIYAYDYVLPLNESKTVARAFHRRFDRSLPMYLVSHREGYYLDSCSSLTVECTVTVFRKPEHAEEAIPVPSSDLTQHLGDLLCSQATADVVFSVEGESFAAHKSVLAARSPVFMTDFFTDRKEENCQRVEIQDMGVTVFKAMLGFIYTDAVPGLDENLDAAPVAFAENLLCAAVRYRLDRLKLMCKRRLARAMDANTVASMLSLAEQQNCSWLKAQCIEFITGGSHENLDAVLATEGCKHLSASSPLLMAELLKAAHGKKYTGSCKTVTVASLENQLRILRSTQAATVRTVKHTYTQLNEGVQSVYLLKIDGFSVTKATIGNNTNCIKSRCTVDGYDLEIRLYPAYHQNQDVYYSVNLELAFLGKACTEGVEASLSGRLVEYQSYGAAPSEYTPVSKVFRQPSDCTSPIYIRSWIAIYSQAPTSLTVECSITMFRDQKLIQLPISDLHQQLSELLDSVIGVDVMFTVSGESFFAHKNILAARSPVFKAEFYGGMEENTARHVEIKDMEAQPETVDGTAMAQHPVTVDGTAMAQHLLVAADRYGLDRLKVMSEHRLSLSIGIETVASTLALAEQFNCPHLKTKCLDFISGGSSKQLDAVLETEGYKNLEVSHPSVLRELLKVTHRNKRSRPTDS